MEALKLTERKLHTKLQVRFFQCITEFRMRETYYTHRPPADGPPVLSEHEGDVHKHRKVAEHYGKHVGT